jgi:hypothetical protein
MIGLNDILILFVQLVILHLPVLMVAARLIGNVTGDFGIAEKQKREVWKCILELATPGTASTIISIGLSPISEKSNLSKPWMYSPTRSTSSQTDISYRTEPGYSIACKVSWISTTAKLKEHWKSLGQGEKKFLPLEMATSKPKAITDITVDKFYEHGVGELLRPGSKGHWEAYITIDPYPTNLRCQALLPDWPKELGSEFGPVSGRMRIPMGEQA